MPIADDQNILAESTLDRALRIGDYIEKLISTIGEHPECELKREWRKTDLRDKAEFIKDIQATANSLIPEDKEKYIVVGADEKTRQIVGCNHSAYDDADIQQLLENYLDPVPDFDVLRLRSANNVDYVVLRFPHQPNRPFVAKASIIDSQKQKIYLREGEIWLKPSGAVTSSSGKRLVKSRTELISLIDMTPHIQKAIADTREQLIPIIRLEERTRLQGQTTDHISALTSSDEEFQSHIEQLLLNPNGIPQNAIKVLLEKLREKTVEVWDVELDPYGYGSQIRPSDLQQIKETDFLPAMHRLVLLSLLFIKFSAPKECFEKVMDLLLQIFQVSNSLKNSTTGINRSDTVSTLGEHTSFTVPALESLLATYFLAGYELSNRNQNVYMRHLLMKIVPEIRGTDDAPSKDFFMFWPVTMNWGYPDRRRDLLVSERFSIGDRLEKLAGGKKSIKAASLQIECLIDWHSFLSFQGQGEPETVRFYQENYSGISTSFWPNFMKEPYELINPLIDKLWEAIHTEGQYDFWLFDSRLSQIFGGIDLARRKHVFARFLMYLQAKQAEYQRQQNRGPYWMPWRSDIAQFVEEVRKTINQQKAI